MKRAIEGGFYYRPFLTAFPQEDRREEREKMNDEGEGKSREPAMGHDTPPAPHPHPYPQPGLAGYPMPAPPPNVAGAYPPDVATAYPSPVAVGYPPGASASTPTPPVQAPYATGPSYYAQGYQNNPGDDERLPCWGLGFGWFLFVIGFFLAAIPWYVGAFILLFLGVDYREKPGYIACTIAAVIAAIAGFFGLMHQVAGW